MGAPYSPDLRERVVAAVASGLSRRAAAARFEPSVSTAIRWTRRMQETGSPAALPMGGERPFALAGEADWVLARLKEKPDITLNALLSELRDRGVAAAQHLGAEEQDPPVSLAPEPDVAVRERRQQQHRRQRRDRAHHGAKPRRQWTGRPPIASPCGLVGCLPSRHGAQGVRAVCVAKLP